MKPQADHYVLPITLPSLEVAEFDLPVPMTDADFLFLLDALDAMRAALTKPRPLAAEPPTTETP